MLLTLFKKINTLFPAISHPFNMRSEHSERSISSNAENLPYAEFEYEHAETTVNLYQKVFPFREWIPGKIIADFACGGGGKSLFLASLGAGIVGVDMNENFIEQAKKYAEQKGFSYRAKFMAGDCQKTNLPAESFDGVILNDAIDHIQNPESALQEAFRILKTGGLIFINFESYLFPRGHHLHDAINIPWIHLFTTESFRIKLYKDLTSKLPDNEERLKLKLGQDDRGRERITYLNHLTIRKFEKILDNFQNGRTHRSLKTLAFHKIPLRKQPFKIFSKLPIVGEMFSSTHVWVLEKI